MTIPSVVCRIHRHGWRTAASNGLVALMALGTSGRALAQLAEVESTATWVLGIFSPVLVLTLLTIFLIGLGVCVWAGWVRGVWFTRALIGAVLVFGGRTIAPQLAAVF